ncbi:EAL domain-containing protein [Gallaecimonas sp. GXIMD4217]|uniref:EAL domain-containing protein n=1 Tax=Gallaecimonas sp. GXIMD4217 TaxID=3131927 RepID=UPI00311ADCC0
MQWMANGKGVLAALVLHLVGLGWLLLCLWQPEPTPLAALPALVVMLSTLAWLGWLYFYRERRELVLAQQLQGLRRRAAQVLAQDETQQLPEVAQALDTLRDRVSFLEQQQSRFDHFIRQSTLLDAETGIGNRSFFEQRLAAWLQEVEGNGFGCLVILELRGLERLDERQRLNWLQLFIGQLDAQLQQWPDSLMARLDEDDFALLLPQMGPREGQQFTLKLLKLIERLPREAAMSREDWCHLGWVLYRTGDDALALLEQAEMALRAAQVQGANGVMAYEAEGAPIAEQGSVRWRALLEQVVARRQLQILRLPVYQLDGDLHHWRVRSQIRDKDGFEIDESIFMPMAVKVGQDLALERQSMARLLDALARIRCKGWRLTHRICVDALMNRDFFAWLKEALAEHRDMLPSLTLAVTEFEVVQFGDGLIGLLRELRSLGLGIQVERVGQVVTDTDYVAAIPVSSIKLHGSLVRHIERHAGNQLVVQGLVRAVLAVDGLVLAQGIGTDEERNMLSRLGVDGGDGPLFGRGPQALLES